MASLEEFRFGRLEEKPSSFHEISVVFKKYEIRVEDYVSPEGRLSSLDSFVRHTSNLEDILSEVYSSEDTRPPRAVFKFKIPPQPIFLLRGKVLELCVDWERRFEEFRAFNPFCIPADRVRQLTKIEDLPQLANFVENPEEFPLDPLLLVTPKGWLRIKDQIVEVFNTHHHPNLLKEWIEEVIERGRVLSEVELLALFEKHDKLMTRKTIDLLKHFKILK
ncbi:hypothetical protein [Candidatus Borrarchaeum sp.]|uniref:hypothetical protein n=1 Tax=Candidatus Borrarchaeum sp. TaxID=2846742 RepID=UPI00257D7C59|nr:hypothetical protein [Candidatus Borrarchaeum sp.]